MALLTPKCREMLDAVKTAGECVRYVRGSRAKIWQVGNRSFHEFTGDALAKRGLLRHFICEHDGNHYDRFMPAENEARTNIQNVTPGIERISSDFKGRDVLEIEAETVEIIGES